MEFLEGKWRHVGTKIGSKIDAKFERPILQKVLKNKPIFNDFCGFWSRSWHQKSIKNRSKIEAQNELPLRIDFWWILGGKLGWKIEPRARKNRLKNAAERMI